MDDLTRSGATLCITPQNLIEFWNVATRSKTENGLGLPMPVARAEFAKHRAAFVLLPDRAEVFAQWEHLVQTYGVGGIQVHDTRLAAVALVYKVPHVLTFNAKDFRLFTPEGLSIVDPSNVPTELGA